MLRMARNAKNKGPKKLGFSDMDSLPCRDTHLGTHLARESHSEHYLPLYLASECVCYILTSLQVPAIVVILTISVRRQEKTVGIKSHYFKCH